MERSDILEALFALHRQLTLGEAMDTDEVQAALDTLYDAHDYDPREPWWEQV